MNYADENRRRAVDHFLDLFLDHNYDYDYNYDFLTDRIISALEDYDQEHNIEIGFEPVEGAQNVQLPVRGTGSSAGYDFYAPCDIVIPAYGVSDLIFFNVKCKLPKDKFLQCVIRSSLAIKHNIMLLTSGVIDADYYGNADNDGNIGIKFINHGREAYTIKKGERCFQGIILDYYTTDNDKPLSRTRNSGYGSTGM